MNADRKGNTQAAESPSRCAEEDRRLVDQCLTGDPDAWERLYRRCHPKLLNAIRALLGPRAANRDLVDEIAAIVWFSLVKQEHRRLDLFDAQRGRRLTTYLGAIARSEILQHFRNEQRRRVRERTASRPRQQRGPASGSAIISELDEFLATLTRREREFFETNLLQTATPRTRFSAANAWQLKHRILRKMYGFFGES